MSSLHSLSPSECLRFEEEELVRRLRIAEDNISRSLQDKKDRLQVHKLDLEEARLRRKLNSLDVLISQQGSRIFLLERNIYAESTITECLNSDFEAGATPHLNRVALLINSIFICLHFIR